MPRFSRTETPQATDEPLGRVKIYDRIYMGLVKNNDDPQKMGRLQVWIPEFGSQPSDPESWVTVSYASPFAGATNPNMIRGSADRSDPRVKRDVNTQTSYGWWGVPPDLENQVLVFFINGDPARGVWFACLYQQNMNHMVPGVAAREENYTKNGRALPVTEYNKRTSERYRDGIQRPESTVQSKAITEQGLINDSIRGITDTSARRESPSKVYGFLTPGPKRKENSDMRTGGSSFYLDDNEDHEHVRIRTKSGAQILIDETNGLIYAINKPGTAWIQMDADGNVDIFGAKSFSVRSQEDINLRADRDVNIEAGRNMNLKASKDYKGGDNGSVASPGSGSGGNVNIKAEARYNLRAKNDILFTSEDGSLQINTSGNIQLATSAAIAFTSSNIDLSQGGSLDVTGNMIASGNAYASDFVSPSVTLNTHIHGGVQSGGGTTSTGLGGGGSSSATGPGAATADTIPTKDKTNILKTFNDTYTRDQENIVTTIERFMTYEPCPEHKNKGEQE